MYDITNFLKRHPGGMKVLLKVAGTDATKQFDTFHNSSILQKLGKELEIGEVSELQEKAEEEETVNPLVVGKPFGDMVPFGDPMWYQDWYR